MTSTSLELGVEGEKAGTRVPVGVGARLAQAALVVSLLPVGAYVVPRVVSLVTSPEGMQESIDLGASYNPRIARVVELEGKTLEQLAALDRIEPSLARVRGTVASVDDKLGGIVAQISDDVQPTLDASVREVDKLLVALGQLRASLAAVGRPVDEIDRTIAEARATMDRILAEARMTGADVQRARTSAANSADNVSGPRK